MAAPRNISILALALVASPLYADTRSSDIEHIITTGSRISASPSNTDLLTSEIAEQEITFTAASHIQEMLNYIAGAGVQRGNGQEYLPALRSAVLTGAGACGGILAAEDNIPLRAAGFCNINELFEAHSEMAERIEVLKGPASALYGSNAIHGVINVITPDTTQDTHMLGWDYGSFGYNRLKVRQGKDYGDTGIGINASVTHDTGYRDDEGVEQQKVNLRHRIETGNLRVMSGLTYTHLDQDTAGYITGYQAYKDDAAVHNNEDPGAFRKATALRLWSRLEWQLEGNNALSVTPYVRDQDMEFKMHFLPGTPMEENDQRGVGVLSQYRYYANANTFWDIGLDAEYTEGGLLQYQQGATPGSAFLTETVPAGKHYDYDVNATMYAPFVAFNWQQEAWQLQVSGRYEHMKYDYTNNMLAGRTREDGSECGLGGCRYSRPPSGDNSFSNISPKLIVQYTVNPKATLYATIARGYRAPQATELYRLQRDQTVAELDAVTADNIEVGVSGQAAALAYQVSLYSLRKDEVIYRDSDFFNINNGETWSRGLEVSMQYAFSKQWDMAFAGSYARHTYEHDELLNGININGNDLDTAPKTQFNTRLGYTFDQDGRVELEWQHVARYYTDPENLHDYEGHDLFNLRASYPIDTGLTVFARINNLLDEHYAERADYSAFGGDRYFPGRPRNVMLSITYEY